MQTFSDSDRMPRARRLGGGANGEVRPFDTPIYPNSVLKSGRQGHLAREASMMASVCHSNIGRVIAKVIPHAVPEGPDELGFLVLEHLGANLQKKESIDRSASQLRCPPRPPHPPPTS